MSLSGLVDTRGSHVTVRRATTSRATDQSTRRAWKTISQDTHVLLAEIPTARAQKLFGLETEATFLVRAHPDTDIRELDGILVESGPFAGERFRVVARTRGEVGPRRLVLGLVATTEDFQ